MLSIEENLIIKNILLDEYEEDGSCKAMFLGENLKVFGGIPKEIVDIKVMTRFDGYLICTVEKVLKPSTYRVVPKCQYYLSCTGCQFQHINYDEQLLIKRKFVIEKLSNIKGFSEDKLDFTIESKNRYGYRNHARFSVSKANKYKGNIGFVNRWSRKLVNISKCEIMSSKINSILSNLEGKLSGHSQFSVRVGINTNSYLIQPKIDEANDIDTGQKDYKEEINGLSHKISSPSFFQVNTLQAENLAKIVKDLLDLKGNEVAIDAFSGVGTFAVLLSKYVKKIYGIESSQSSINDAIYNSKLIQNIEFIHSEVENVSSDFFNENIDFVILDPSRKGVHEVALDWIEKLLPDRIVYVSCELKTLKRDLGRLTNNYSIRKVIPVDMFPHTKHVECIVSLDRTSKL
mgnify:CR=1 FL=1|tara:strand:+ start:4081 stop:5286 length:1206 start_codon:yes stop_codon:yes gene_type:complete